WKIVLFCLIHIFTFVSLAFSADVSILIYFILITKLIFMTITRTYTILYIQHLHKLYPQYCAFRYLE
ncbi:hypothetical protein L9F63_002133, partial [Diploptera punctata]